MTDRVLIDSSVLKVSKPGVNVLTAGIADLIFSSDFGSFAFYNEGSLSYSWSGGSEFATYSNDVHLGKTFATPPAVMFQLSLGSNRYTPIGDASGFAFVKENFGDRDSYLVAYATVTNSHIQFRGSYNRYENLSTSVSIRYSIYEYNL